MGKIKDKFWLDRSQAVLVIIDVQEKLVPAVNQTLYRQLLLNAQLLVEGFTALGLPMIATEQYPRGLGHTVTELQAAAGQHCIEKMTFSCCGDNTFVDALEKTGARQVVVAGMETHVCVLQTVIDLLDRDFTVHLIKDAVASRFVSDYDNAIALMAGAGAVTSTTETALFQLVKVAGSEEFKAISRLVRQRIPA